jgi:hypothetical protein
MRRRDCFKLVGAAAALMPMRPMGADAETGRIGLLATASEGLNSATRNALRTGLVLICRSADAGAERWPALAAELLPLGVDLIVMPAAQAAEDATGKRSEFPSVRLTAFMGNVGNPVSEQERKDRLVSYPGLYYRATGRQNPQGGCAGGSSGRAADQALNGHPSQDRPGARHPDDAHRGCRRG